MKWIFILPIVIYRATLSRILPPLCRFDPTCAEYSQRAFLLHGVVRGLTLSLRRLLKCHPWGGSGIDDVPGDTLEGPRGLWPPARWTTQVQKTHQPDNSCRDQTKTPA